MPKYDKMNWSKFESYDQLSNIHKATIGLSLKRFALTIPPQHFFQKLKEGKRYCFGCDEFISASRFKERGGFCEEHIYLKIAYNTLREKEKEISAEQRRKDLLSFTGLEKRKCQKKNCKGVLTVRKHSYRKFCDECLAKGKAYDSSGYPKTDIMWARKAGVRVAKWRKLREQGKIICFICKQEKDIPKRKRNKNICSDCK